ncbi:hypothetical protein [Planktothrix sp. FACHB-1365]|uniref:hypothetical protein n=1 Tax=Planktothrix sp. FACHB-1365 TaxID=2692855 RepID=UPI0018EF4CB6|nr:hypothetical protein [Planktothrix sp. FACHB-1365]
MFGKLEGQEFIVEQEKLEMIKQHLADNFPDFHPNQMMIKRLELALNDHKKISGADASFYFHELREAELMEQGLIYKEAHKQALKDYEVSPFSVYHPDVIRACPDEFNKNWERAWGIT